MKDEAENPYDNASCELFMKTLKREETYGPPEEFEEKCGQWNAKACIVSSTITFFAEPFVCALCSRLKIPARPKLCLDLCVGWFLSPTQR
jgi:hypothetical protein